jgi:hypothetical protein
MPDLGNSQQQKGWCRKVKVRTTDAGWCKAMEDMHHIFVACPEHTKLRKDARDDLVKKM